MREKAFLILLGYTRLVSPTIAHTRLACMLTDRRCVGLRNVTDPMGDEEKRGTRYESERGGSGGSKGPDEGGSSTCLESNAGLSGRRQDPL